MGESNTTCLRLHRKSGAEYSSRSRAPPIHSVNACWGPTQCLALACESVGSGARFWVQIPTNCDFGVVILELSVAHFLHVYNWGMIASTLWGSREDQLS